MSANAPDAVIRMPGHWFNGDNTPCDVCGGHLPDHAWADLDSPEDEAEPPRVVDCSGETR